MKPCVQVGTLQEDLTWDVQGTCGQFSLNITNLRCLQHLMQYPAGVWAVGLELTQTLGLNVSMCECHACVQVVMGRAVSLFGE